MRIDLTPVGPLLLILARRQVLRLLMLLALIAAGPILTALAAWTIWIAQVDTWPVELRAMQLQIVGGLAFVYAGLLGVCIVSLAAVKVEAQGGLGRLSIGGDDDDNGRPPAA